MSADSTRFTVRRGVPADLDAVLDVQRRSSGWPVSARAHHDTAAALDDPTRLFIVAETDARMIGWAKTKHYAEPDGHAPAGHYLMGILVDPECRSTAGWASCSPPSCLRHGHPDVGGRNGRPCYIRTGLRPKR